MKPVLIFRLFLEEMALAALFAAGVGWLCREVYNVERNYMPEYKAVVFYVAVASIVVLVWKLIIFVGKVLNKLQ